MVFLLIVLAGFVGLISIGAWRTIATLVFSIYSTILLILGFGVGGLFSLIIYPESVQHWQISQSWVTQIVDSPDVSILQLFSIPFVFVGDIYRWMFEITIFHGNPILWFTMIVTAWKIVVDAKRAYRSFMDGRNEIIEMRSTSSTRNDDSNTYRTAVKTPQPGYDAAGHFIGFKTVNQAMKHGYY